MRVGHKNKLQMKWKSEKLKNLCRLGSGGTPLTSRKEYYNGNIKWAIIGDLNGEVIYETENTITEEGLKNSSGKLVPKNTLLVGMYGSVGKTAVTGCELSTNQAIAFIIPNEKLNLWYLKYFIDFNVSELFKLSRGGTQRNINQEILKNFEIPLSSIEEQQKIVSEIERQFTRLDKSVKSLQNIKEKIKTYKQSVLKSAFEVKAEEDWVEMNLEDVCEDLFAGGDVPKDNFSKIKTEKYNIPIFSNGVTDKGLYGYTGIKKVIKSSITISARGTIGYSEIRVGGFYPIVRLIVLTPNSNIINLSFLKYKIDCINFTNTGTSTPQLTIPMIRNRTIYVCPLSKQKQIVQEIEKRFSTIENVKQIVEESINKTEKLRKSILKSAFEGNLIK